MATWGLSELVTPQPEAETSCLSLWVPRVKWERPTFVFWSSFSAAHHSGYAMKSGTNRKMTSTLPLFSSEFPGSQMGKSRPYDAYLTLNPFIEI